MLQAGSLPLMRSLCDRGFTVLLETSGALDVEPVDPRVCRIVDLKCPSSGEVAHNRWANLALLGVGDEVKFVVATIEDYDWMRRTIQEHQLHRRCAVLVSWAGPLTAEQVDPSLNAAPGSEDRLSRRALAERVVADGLPVRLQLQLHKFIWSPDQKGV